MHNWNNRVLIFGAGIVQGTYAGFLPLSGEVPDGEQNTSTHENMASFCCDVFVYQGPQVSQEIRKEIRKEIPQESCRNSGRLYSAPGYLCDVPGAGKV